MPLIKLEDFAKANDVTDEELSSLRKFAQEQKEVPIRTNARGEIQVESIYGDSLIKHWREHAQADLRGKKKFVEEKLWRDHATSLINTGVVASESDLAFGYYMGGAALIESFVNLKHKPLPMVLIVDKTEDVLKLQSASFIENPADYPIRITLPLNEIIWAVIKRVSLRHDHVGTAESGAPYNADNETAENTGFCLVITYKQPTGVGELIFKAAFVDEDKTPKQSFFDFAHTLQTFTPFYREEDGQEYFDVEL